MTKSHEKFKSVNGRCIPWSEDIKDLYDSNSHEELLSLENCVISYNELVVSKNNGRPFNILEIVADQNIKPKKLRESKNFLKISIIFFVIFFVILIIAIVIYKINLNSKKNLK